MDYYYFLRAILSLYASCFCRNEKVIFFSDTYNAHETVEHSPTNLQKWTWSGCLKFWHLVVKLWRFKISSSGISIAALHSRNWFFMTQHGNNIFWVRNCTNSTYNVYWKIVIGTYVNSVWSIFIYIHMYLHRYVHTYVREYDSITSIRYRILFTYIFACLRKW